MILAMGAKGSSGFLNNHSRIELYEKYPDRYRVGDGHHRPCFC